MSYDAALNLQTVAPEGCGNAVINALKGIILLRTDPAVFQVISQDAGDKDDALVLLIHHPNEPSADVMNVWLTDWLRKIETAYGIDTHRVPPADLFSFLEGSDPKTSGLSLCREIPVMLSTARTLPAGTRFQRETAWDVMSPSASDSLALPPAAFLTSSMAIASLLIANIESTSFNSMQAPLSMKADFS